MDTGDFPNADNPNRGDRRGATSRRPAAGNPNRRDRRGTRAAASGRPGVDDGADPNPAAGLTRRELRLEIRREQYSLSEQMRHEQQLLNEEIIRGGDVHYHRERLRELGGLLRSSETLLQASSSAAPPSEQNFLRLQHFNSVAHVEIRKDSATQKGSTRLFADERIAHPGAEGSVTGTHIRQSALYSSRPRRPRRKHTPLPTQDHPSEVSSSELGGAVTDLPTLDEALSLSDPPPLTPQISDEETTDDDDACSHLYRPGDVGRSISPIVLTKSMLQSLGDRFFTTVPYEAMRRPDSDSDEDHEGVIQDGKQWMRDEVTLCFRKHVEKTRYLAGVVFELDELCHQCFDVENSRKVFQHYNFKIRMKMPAAVEWTKELYFGEVKEIFGTKFYFCCPLEPNESGHCYACQNQGVEDLRHPVTGGFEMGMPDALPSNFWY
ncbi:hypothetical protein PR202_ga22632 [Eleusine coracana subsp. coracana]|uniref:DUF3615 domain-containing protein n=1 Tax=Eleusine coracana subsp. coracana TaxID=191504 RepID=A0AAV5D3K3_ELECO|nr:hypothetical protein PR202_ga22632 [Eleusine coracana subsp. coracana]